MPRLVAQSTTAVATAPDWVRKATRPASAGVPAKLASSRACGIMMPRQFGPTIRKM